MNKLEREMKDLLVRGREEFGWLAVKAEFEAEGTRLDELLRLVEIAHRADVQIAVKIGGCEALMDLFEAKLIGTDYIVAPMIETPYALTKYEAAVRKAFNDQERQDCDFLWNIETDTGFKTVSEMATFAAGSETLQGIVFGRSDYCGSLGMSSDAVNEPRVLSDVCAVAQICKDNKLDLVVGGGVSRDSIDFLRTVQDIHLSRFETRKVVMSADALKLRNIADGLLAALQFELKWLTNKRDYYNAIYLEDEKRFTTLQQRWGVDA
jgi:hypothetical protein